MTCKRRPAILKKQLSLVFYTKDDFLYFSCLILYNKLIDLCRFINLSTLCAGHDTCRGRSEQDSVEVESSVIKLFSSLWSTKMTSTTKVTSEKRTRNQFTAEKLYLLIEAYPIRQFFFFVSAIFKVFKLKTRYLIFQSVYSLWSSAKMKQFKEIISYCRSF